MLSTFRFKLSEGIVAVAEPFDEKLWTISIFWPFPGGPAINYVIDPKKPTPPRATPTPPQNEALNQLREALKIKVG